MTISLKAGAYGINLSCANHVLLVDPCCRVYIFIFIILEIKQLKEFIELDKIKQLRLYILFVKIQ